MDETILALTDKVIEELMRSETYQSLLKTTNEIKEDAKIQKLIHAFKEAEKNYHEARHYGKHHPDLSARQLLLQETKIALYTDPLIIEHKKHEKTLQEALDVIASRLKAMTSTQEPINPQGGKPCSNENA